VSAPVIAQPDVEAWVWANIRDLPGVTSFAYSAVQQDSAGWIMAHFVQVDCRAKGKAAARANAEAVRQLLVGLPAVPWPEGAICYLQPVEGPFWLPDDDGSPRYVARYEIRVHPPRAPVAGP
jgi:hypothetical protein